MKEPSPALPGIQLSACFLATAFIWTLLPLAAAASHPDDNYSSAYEGAGSYLRPRSGLVDTIFTDRLLQETCNETCCEQFQKTCPKETSANPFSSVPLWGQIVLIVVLIGFSALFSGLTLGLMSLDKTGLEIVIGGDDERYREMAKKIYPIRENGNLLLCTLLLGNVSVNALLSILLADKAGGIVGFLASTFLIVIFGEIIPQASCSRYALEIGSKTVPLVRVIILLFYPIAFPLAWALDRALGQELATTYSNAEMLKLLQIHVHEEKMDLDTANAMTGALKYRDMAVKDVMTPLANAFMLSVEEKLNFETIAKIFKTGYSRIPVYEINKVRLLTT
jgi:CBS domain containing-hemolysin-like protein